MKLSLILASLVFISSSAFAANDRLVCREQSGKKITVVVTTGKDLPVKEDEALDSRREAIIEIYTDDFITAQFEEKGIVETEDVMFGFQSNNKKISFHAYMDEMDQSGLSMNGKNIPLVCF